MKKLINFLIISVTIISFIGCVTIKSHDHSQHKKLKFGAPTEGMSTEEYQSLIFLILRIPSVRITMRSRESMEIFS